MIVKDEADYLQDWLIFHAAAGVRHIFIYDNGSTDKTGEIARDFQGCDITVTPWAYNTSVAKPGIALQQQVMCYCHAILNYGAKFRWMSFIDTDEYLVPQKGGSIPDTLNDLEAFTNISLPWVMFGHNGHLRSPKEPVPFAYTARARHLSGSLLNFKCIVDPCDVTQVSVHKFLTRTMGQGHANTLGRVVQGVAC
ncbi:glycosyltransferase family 92 protein [Halocynthiibacter sp.]|uniref:glycosyltransferase family 92 protein n=1 Tax=Halocynthiibacter sp. TaxID=1979210 RepID=UPI003C47919D